MTTTTDHNAYVLARMADVSSPDSPESPGAAWLLRVAGAIDDYDDWTSSDTIHEAAGKTPRCRSTRTTGWQVFVDLAAYQEDVTEYGPIEDMGGGKPLALRCT